MTQLSSQDFDHLQEEVGRLVSSGGRELVDVEYKLERGEWVLRVYIDKPGGVNHDDCAVVSREVGMMLDVENLIPQSYNLEISSPGLDRPLKKLEDYGRYTGKLVRIKLNPGRQGRKKFRGRITAVEGEEIVIEDEGESQTHRLPLSEIHSARLEIEL